MTVHGAGEQIESVLAQLRAEEPLEQELAQQALLRHECGVLEEARDDEKAALREYLAAYNTAPEFREPLEALVRIYGRKREDKNLLKVLEALVQAASTPAESARALWELAAYRQDIEDDVEAAAACLRRAVEADPEDAACWLQLELLAAETGDAATRLRALEARARLTSDPTWQGLLLTELAEHCAQAGDVARAAQLLDGVVAIEGRAQFRSRLVLEELARQAQDSELWAHALEGKAELIAAAVDDPELGDRCGVPLGLRTPELAADAWLRAGELRRQSGDVWGAVAALQAAAARMPDDSLLARLRMAAADAAGDAPEAVKMARDLVERGVGGVVGAALWVRIGQDAESREVYAEALDAYAKALECDSSNIVALTMRIDLLAQGDDAQALATALETQAQQASSKAAKQRAWLAVAYVWVVRVGNTQRGRWAIEQAEGCGASLDLSNRLARTLAAISEDHSWYEMATEKLLSISQDLGEQATLAFDLGRIRLSQDRVAEAREAFGVLAASGGSEETKQANAWLGHALTAYAVGVKGGEGLERTSKLLESLAQVETDAELGHGLALVAAMLLSREGRRGDAITMLQRVQARKPDDVTTACFLADMCRANDDLLGAVEALSLVADALHDSPMAGALRLEAAFCAWHAGDRKGAIEICERTLKQTPQATRLVLGWALRSIDPDDLHSRRRAVELAEESSADRASGALERFGLGIASKGGELDAWAALEQLEDLNAGGDIAIATALGRLLWRGDAPDHDAIEQALKQIELLGSAGEQIAVAERYRLTRFDRQDHDSMARTVKAWAEVLASLPASLECLGTAVKLGDRVQEAESYEMIASHFDGEVAAQLQTMAAIVKMVHAPGQTLSFVEGDSVAARLTNFELTLPGGDAERRAQALRGLGQSLGEEVEHDAAVMAAWSDLARGDTQHAQKSFKMLTDANASDLAAWEGFRAASETLKDHISIGVANARLGSLCRDDARAAAFWEAAGLVLLEHTEAAADAEIAFTRALDRDRTRPVAFDKLFRRVRSRKDHDHLLKLIELRLKVTEDTEEITKMYWERARVMRSKGDQDAALKCLEDVTLLQPAHVGALALAGEIYISKGDFAKAAPLLAQLATLDEAPQQQRLVSGIAAVDLYEKKLKSPDRAYEVLKTLSESGLATLKVRERVARMAARSGRWEDALLMLHQLMDERDTSKGRAEAARLAMVICRDKLKKPKRAMPAMKRLLMEVPDDSEVFALILEQKVYAKLKIEALPTTRKFLLAELRGEPFNLERMRLLARLTAEQVDYPMQRIAIGCLLALGDEDDVGLSKAAARIDARSDLAPQIVLDAEAMKMVAAPADAGPLAELFALMAPAVSEALGPSLKSQGVGRRERVDAAGSPLRVAISRWMGALGIGDFDLYISDREPRAIIGVAGDRPALVVGSEINAPLSPVARAAVAREAYALRRGTTAAIRCDDHTIASIATAVCNEVGVATPEPAFAIYKEVHRTIKKALSRKLKKQLVGTCQQVVEAKQDARAWAAAARCSIDRMVLLACADVSILVDDIVGAPGTPARSALDGNARARHAFTFVLSDEFFALRKKLGMGVA